MKRIIIGIVIRIRFSGWIGLKIGIKARKKMTS